MHASVFFAQMQMGGPLGAQFVVREFLKIIRREAGGDDLFELLAIDLVVTLVDTLHAMKGMDEFVRETDGRWALVHSGVVHAVLETYWVELDGG